MKKSVLPFLTMLVIVCFTGCQKAPMASFTYWIEPSDEGAKVHFTNNSTNAEYCEWDFGVMNDYFIEEMSTEWSPVHIYTYEDWYTVRLTVHKGSKSHSVSQEVYIDSYMLEGGSGGGGGGYTPPTANFSFTGNNQYAPATVNFTNLSSNASSYQWNFGDGATSSATNPTHIYTSSGNYTVTLKAMNSAGSNQTSRTVPVAAASSAGTRFWKATSPRPLSS